VIPRIIDRVLSDAPGAVGAYYNAYKSYRWGDPYIHLIASLADRSQVAVDVGAHLGDYTFFMRRHAAGCIAFECNPALVAHLRRRLGNPSIFGRMRFQIMTARRCCGFLVQTLGWAWGVRRSRKTTL
jgi:hypothetical protein